MIFMHRATIPVDLFNSKRTIPIRHKLISVGSPSVRLPFIAFTHGAGGATCSNTRAHVQSRTYPRNQNKDKIYSFSIRPSTTRS